MLKTVFFQTETKQTAREWEWNADSGGQFHGRVVHFHRPSKTSKNDGRVAFSWFSGRQSVGGVAIFEMQCWKMTTPVTFWAPGGVLGALGGLWGSWGGLWECSGSLWRVFGVSGGVQGASWRGKRDLISSKICFFSNHYMNMYVPLFHVISIFICRLDYLWHICFFISKSSLYVHTLVCCLGRPHSTNV